MSTVIFNFENIMSTLYVNNTISAQIRFQATQFIVKILFDFLKIYAIMYKKQIRR